MIARYGKKFWYKVHFCLETACRVMATTTLLPAFTPEGRGRVRERWPQSDFPPKNSDFFQLPFYCASADFFSGLLLSVGLSLMVNNSPPPLLRFIAWRDAQKSQIFLVGKKESFFAVPQKICCGVTTAEGWPQSIRFFLEGRGGGVKLWIQKYHLSLPPFFVGDHVMRKPFFPLTAAWWSAYPLYLARESGYSRVNIGLLCKNNLFLEILFWRKTRFLFPLSGTYTVKRGM